ncbi:arginase family protein [Micromonospora inaquosa]|nr:arginase family protein [Micromonospora inaquosa]
MLRRRRPPPRERIGWTSRRQTCRRCARGGPSPLPWGHVRPGPARHATRADVLDKSVMPAVDSPIPDGLSVTELTTVLATLLASPNAVGMHVGIYDPELDPTVQVATALVDAIVNAFETANKHN